MRQDRAIPNLESPTARLAAFTAGLRYEHLTEPDRRAARRHLLDTLAAIVAGRPGGAAEIAARTLAAVEPEGDVPVPGDARRWLRLSAAYLGGASAHGLEVDDGYRAGSVHPGAPVIPAALAAAYGTRASGAALMTAIAVGYELTTRIAAAAHPSSRQRGFHNTSIAGVFGAAGAAASLFGLDAERCGHALGIAASSAAGLFAFLQGGGDIKRLHPGMAAREGLYAALLAREGMTGPHGVLEGPDGFLQAYSGAGKPNALVDGLELGAPGGLNVTRCYMKPYACCRHIHPAIDAVIDILASEKIAPEAISRVLAGTYAIAAEHAKGGWGDMASAQMSYQYCVATAARTGVVDIASFKDAALRDAATEALCGRIAVGVNEACEASYPSNRSAEVEVALADGRSFRRLVDEPRGSAKYPLSDAEVEAKFDSLAAPVIGAPAAARLRELVSRLDALTDADALLDASALPARARDSRKPAA